MCVCVGRVVQRSSPRTSLSVQASTLAWNGTQHIATEKNTHTLSHSTEERLITKRRMSTWCDLHMNLIANLIEFIFHGAPYALRRTQRRMHDGTRQTRLLVRLHVQCTKDVWINDLSLARGECAVMHLHTLGGDGGTGNSREGCTVVVDRSFSFISIVCSPFVNLQMVHIVYVYVSCTIWIHYSYWCRDF